MIDSIKHSTVLSQCHSHCLLIHGQLPHKSQQCWIPLTLLYLCVLLCCLCVLTIRVVFKGPAHSHRCFHYSRWWDPYAQVAMMGNSWVHCTPWTTKNDRSVVVPYSNRCSKANTRGRDNVSQAHCVHAHTFLRLKTHRTHGFSSFFFMRRRLISL